MQQEGKKRVVGKRKKNHGGEPRGHGRKRKLGALRTARKKREGARFSGGADLQAIQIFSRGKIKEPMGGEPKQRRG